MEQTNIGFCIESDNCHFGVRVIVNQNGQAKLEHVSLLDQSATPEGAPTLPLEFNVDLSKISEILGFLPEVSRFVKTTYPGTSVKLMWQFNRTMF